ncbi:toxin co-regulated pilus biosynthesis Q family protein [Halomonas elongata]|uniref:toxin co-regulated pilus biosynthesis Q family protein n=1 Tax=Halomonas elongata TaxID=2746 RepID=UPI00255AE7EF|nr:toxin co-regulated pilus biosynthesis Q family protein [Halomonas elongata]MDL4860766.1 toxin co-regulated pilus biosynthesis Q family protein [Halomonas elongata]
MNRALAVAVIIVANGLGGCAVQAENTTPPIITDLEGPYLGGAQSVDLSSSTSVGVDAKTAAVSTPLTSSNAEEVTASQLWFIPKGGPLSEGLQKWADESGWSLVWESQVDYHMASSVSFDGAIEQAVKKLILLYSKAENPLYADISPQQRLIVVSDDPTELGYE